MLTSAWILTAYLLGTLIGWYFGKVRDISAVTEMVVDHLVANGYLRHRTSPDGQTEILKLNEE